MDPGLDTGLSLFKITPTTYEPLDHATVRWNMDRRDPPLSSPLRVLKTWRAQHPSLPHRLLYEDFHIRPGQTIPDTTALRVLGAVEIWFTIDSPDAYAQVIKQEPVQGKHLGTDDALRRAGLYGNDKDTSRHVRDANRHAVVYLSRLRHIPLIKAAWPPRSVTSKP